MEKVKWIVVILILFHGGRCRRILLVSAADSRGR